MKIPLDKVEATLASLWADEEKRGGRAAHASLLTLVALVSESRLFARARAVATHVTAVHPNRTVFAVNVEDEGKSKGIEAEAWLERNPARGNEAAGEAILLETAGGARDWLPENVDRLLLSGIPSCIWWIGDLPDSDDLFDRMVRRADIAVVNSSEMDLRDLEKLSQIAKASRGTYALLDLTWVRLRGMQDLVARFFDSEDTRPYLDHLTRVTFGYSPRDGETDAASTRVGLFIGWLAHALGMKPESARWRREGPISEVTLERTGFPDVVMRVERDKRAEVNDGAITRLELSCDPLTAGAEGARFTLARQDDPRTVVWSCEAPGLVLPPQTLRFGGHEEHKLLIRCLERPARDPLLDASLEAGSRIVRPVAPRLSALPPPPR